MGNEEARTPSKPEVSSPAQEHANIHAYPNWAAIQAYYGPGVTLPHPYFNSGIAPGHPPHPYIWGAPQPLMPPYGSPYAAIYSHGGVYGHPTISLGSHSQGHGNSSSPAVCEAVTATPLGMLTPTKSSSNKDQGLIKKLKGFDGLAVSIGNDNSGSADVSQSVDCGAEGSSDGSDGNTAARKGQKQRKGSCEGVPNPGKDGKVNTQAMPIFVGEANSTFNSSLGVTVASAGVSGKAVGTVPSPNGKTKSVAATFPPAPNAGAPVHGIPSELLIKDERELKRERRKQSNRESARRSRLRKQAETDELALKVETLSTENLTLRSEIGQLTQNSVKLRLENAALMEKLKNAELEQDGEMVSNNMEAEGAPIVSTENFLARVNNSPSFTGSKQRESEANENSNSGAKLHQLLESSPRADAVAAR